MVILEPRISGREADLACKRIGYPDWIRSEARGFSGGIWILWDGNDISLKVIHAEFHFIHVLIREADGRGWEMSAIYASPNRTLRPALWRQLDAIKPQFPWVLLGDFNCTLRDGERNITGGVSTSFADWVQSTCLIDVGFVGPLYTWNHGREAACRKSARLDRALCDDRWRVQFPEATLRHLHHFHSDHTPILLQTSGASPSGIGRRPFRFQAAWLDHKDFAQLVQDSWVGGNVITQKLGSLAQALQRWNKTVFGNVFQRKRRLLRRLEGIQRAMAQLVTPGLLKLEEKLRDELNETLRQEELVWMLKSRVQWLRDGDRNTKYFHTATLVRRRRNKIMGLLDENGVWVMDQQRLKELAVGFYSSLFRSESCLQEAFPSGLFPSISEAKLLSLQRECSDDEVKRALFEMGPYKAPGPDGFHAGFFQCMWPTTGPSLIAMVKQVMAGGGTS